MNYRSCVVFVRIIESCRAGCERVVVKGVVGGESRCVFDAEESGRLEAGQCGL